MVLDNVNLQVKKSMTKKRYNDANGPVQYQLKKTPGGEDLRKDHAEEEND